MLLIWWRRKLGSDVNHVRRTASRLPEVPGVRRIHSDAGARPRQPIHIAALRRASSGLVVVVISTDGALPSWVQHFRTRRLFLDHEGRMVQKDNDLFVDDAPQISRHFADAPELSFLWVIKPNGGRPSFQTPPGSGTSHPLGKRKSGTSGKRGTRTGHLMSYVLLKDKSIADESREANSEAALEKRRTGAIAVKFFMENQAARWKSLTEMPELNPGFDVLAVAHDGEEEFIEVKGQTDVWTERGVTLTPRELLEAQKRRGRYWLCVVEYVHDEKRRRLYLFQDPFGLADQFKFDSGWKAAAIAINDAPLQPESGRFIDISGEGHGKIISVTKRGKLFHLHVLLDTGKPKNLLFKPDKMVVSEQ